MNRRSFLAALPGLALVPRAFQVPRQELTTLSGAMREAYGSSTALPTGAIIAIEDEVGRVIAVEPSDTEFPTVTLSRGLRA